jgi:hypothetical protein
MASRRTGLDRQQGRRPCRQTGGHLVRLGGVGAGLLLELRVGHQFDVDGYGEAHLRAGQDEEPEVVDHRLGAGLHRGDRGLAGDLAAQRSQVGRLACGLEASTNLACANPGPDTVGGRSGNPARRGALAAHDHAAGRGRGVPLGRERRLRGSALRRSFRGVSGRGLRTPAAPVLVRPATRPRPRRRPAALARAHRHDNHRPSRTGIPTAGHNSATPWPGSAPAGVVSPTGDPSSPALARSATVRCAQWSSRFLDRCR